MERYSKIAKLVGSYKRYLALYAFVLIVLGIPTFADAQSRDWYRDVDTRSLDDDVVESLPIPILFGILQGQIRPDFGDPRGDGTREHEGQDIMAPKGAPIVSPTEAVVTRVGDGDDSGLYVSTANPGGESFRYMHLDTIAEIRAGDKLEAGDFIGTVGNTGNASGGAAHLHFEIHEDGDPTDPYPRLDGEFTFKEKISFLKDVFDNYDGSTSEYAEFLVETYPQELRRALNEKLSLPRPITQALNKAGIVDTSDLHEKLDQLIDSIPALLTRDLSLGDSGPEVSLLQFFLILRSDNAPLRGAGATGYFGSITQTALREYQRTIKVEETGVFDDETRERAGR